MSLAGNRIRTQIRMMNGNDGGDYEYEMNASVSDFKWRRFEHPESPADESSGTESAGGSGELPPQGVAAFGEEGVIVSELPPQGVGEHPLTDASPSKPATAYFGELPPQGFAALGEEISTSGVKVTEVMTELGSETITELQITREDLEKVD